jgi:hypothetical protein
MINPNMQNFPGIPTFPGMGAMTDTLEFVKNLWGGMGIPGMNMSGANMPGMVVPTLSVEEIRKKVSDLKAVETWLELNMSMLRGTIQALEVQAATLSTLKSMGDALSATMNPTGGFGQAAQQRPAGSSSAHAPASSYGSEQRSSAEQGAPVTPTSKDEADAASLTAPLVNAAAWWNLLQDQFQQAVNTAMHAEVPAMPAVTPPKSRAGADTKADSRAGADSRGDSDAAPVAPRKRRSPK